MARINYRGGGQWQSCSNDKHQHSADCSSHLWKFI